MPDILISYAKEDRLTARLLAAKLREGGHEVFWDRRIKAGAESNEEIQAALRNARCVLVLWSAASRKPFGYGVKPRMLVNGMSTFLY